MHFGKRILGVITARGGSKGIPRKNIAPLLGRPLIAYTIDAARESALLTRAFVSTDDEEIAAVARAHGAEVPFLRPAALATDEASSMSVLQHALAWAEEAEGAAYDYVMTLQPTSPLRTAEDIDACIKKAVETGADSVISVVEVSNFGPHKMHRIADDRIVSYFPEYDVGRESQRRQELPPLFRRNGAAVYITRAALIKEGDLFGAVSRPYVMPPERSVDIDHPHDLALAEFWLARLREYR